VPVQLNKNPAIPFYGDQRMKRLKIYTLFGLIILSACSSTFSQEKLKLNGLTSVEFNFSAVPELKSAAAENKGYPSNRLGGQISASGGLNNSKKVKTLSIKEFIQTAAKNDKVFDIILIEQLKLNYRKAINLPAKDIILSVKGEYDFFLPQNKEEPNVTLSLSKLFPYTGTDISLSYKNIPSSTSTTSGSELAFLISQPIARNAFGKTTKLKDKIIGIEIDVARHQIVEAFEDYMAALVTIYYDWYSAYENLKIGESSYNENSKLKDNIYERKKQKIALPIDVNKVELLVLGKKEDLIALKEKYKNLTNLIEKAVRHESDAVLLPIDPANKHKSEVDFKADYKKFTEKSRTYKILDMLGKKSKLEVKKSADDLLPSTNLMIGYKMDGDNWEIKNKDDMFYVGISMEWPFPSQVKKAEFEVSKIRHRKTKISNQNKYLELHTNLKNLYLGIKREKELIKIADKKIKLAEKILKDEAENYSFGKVTLNDYIAAVNRLDQNKFNKISHTIKLKKLFIEWLRLTDQLVDKKVLSNGK
jgi:hypothetical protein